MKRFGQFIFLLIVFIIVAYVQPLFFPSEETKKIIPAVEETDVTLTHTSFPYGEINATGLAIYIGKSPQALTKVYGEPIEIQQSGLGFEWWVLGEDGDDYLQVAVRGNKITSIFALGQGLDLDPFEIGMDLTDIAELTTIYSNFDLDFQKEHYKIDLTEEDMNYRPLIAYDNESFAILHLNQGTGTLSGVRYVDKETLLELMPYQLNQGNFRQVNYDKELDWEVINTDRQRQLQSFLTILRQRDNFPPYTYLPELSAAADKALASFLEKPTEVLSDSNRILGLETGLNSASFNQAFYLSKSEFDKLVTTSKIEGEGIHGIAFAPSYDVPYLALSWYGENTFQRQFMRETDLGVGVAFRENMVLFLFVESKMEQSTTETSQLFKNHSSQEDSR